VGYRVGEGPTLLVTAGLHGPEYIGVQVALAVLEAGPPEGFSLLVCPVLNPDGYARTWAMDGDAPLAVLRKNSRGVDLNRNFPPPAHRQLALPFSGSDDPGSATYRGPGPLSEPETDALARLVESSAPRAAVGLHSFMGTQITPPVRSRRAWSTYTRLCRALRAAQPGRGYPRLATPVGDVFTGELEDWLHHTHRCWSVCVECFSVLESARQHLRAPTVFWRFNPREPASVRDRDRDGVLAWLAAAASEPPPDDALSPRAQIPAADREQKW
jgi:predicted deacylase